LQTSAFAWGPSSESEGNAASSTRQRGPAVAASAQKPLAPELIKPEQHQDPTGSEITDRPAVRVMLAVMQEAIATYRRGLEHTANAVDRRLFRDVVRWIESTDDRPVFSFERICATLEFDAAAARRRLRRWARLEPSDDPNRRRTTYRRTRERQPAIRVTRPRLRKRGKQASANTRGSRHDSRDSSA
jgi:hypothetical protein